MKRLSANSQQGAAAIEFSLVFVILFVIFYGMVGYFIPFLLVSSYEEIAADALASAVREPNYFAYEQMDVQQQQSYLQARNEITSRVVESSWIPPRWREPCSGYGGRYLKVDTSSGIVWSTCLRNSTPNSILPTLSLMGWEIPSLPDEIRGEAQLRVR